MKSKLFQLIALGMCCLPLSLEDSQAAECAYLLYTCIDKPYNPYFCEVYKDIPEAKEACEDSSKKQRNPSHTACMTGCREAFELGDCSGVCILGKDQKTPKAKKN